MSPNISVEMFPAGNGDAILINLGEQNILIDAGYTSTYRDHLKTRLQALNNQGKTLSRFIVTHIDADHISGAIAFMKENGPADRPAVIGIDEVWFNSYRHLKFRDKEAGRLDQGRPDLQIKGGLESTEADVQDELVSHRQGTTLGSQLLRHGYDWNHSFEEKAVRADDPLELDLKDGVRLTLLNPTQEALDDMATKWNAYLRQRFAGRINEDDFFDDAFELMMEEMRQADLDRVVVEEERLVAGEGDWVEENAVEFRQEDTSDTNGSSITFLLKFDGKKLLFLGDAIPSQIIMQVKKMVPEDQRPLHVDVLKVSHHGAWSNNDPELFDLVHADYYLFSSNGLRHHHPHFETMAWILKKNPTFKTLVFNYKQGDRLRPLDDLQLQQKYNYDVLWPEVNEWGQGTDGYIRLDL